MSPQTLYNRFSDRAEHYVKYRPSYPLKIIKCLTQECGLNPKSVIADIGSGTGLLAQIFLENGHRLIGIEPDQIMRKAGDRFLICYPSFASKNATAEATGLLNQSVDFIIAGHAAHWFKASKARAEFKRILRPEGTIALIWNTRYEKGSIFMGEFEKIMRQFSQNNMGQPGFEAGEKRAPEKILGRSYQLRTFPHYQNLNFEGLLGRVLSSSMMPLQGEDGYDPMIKTLRELFEKHQINGIIQIHYKTEMFFT